MRVRNAPLSALALAAALAVGGAGEALAQQPTTRPRSDTTRTGMPTDTARAGMPADTARGGRTTTTSAGEVANLAGAAAAPIIASLQTDAHAMALLHESNLGEIAAGQRAIREARDSSVRAFAQMMISEHTALDSQATALGQRLNVTPALPDSALPQLQQGELQALPTGTGAAGATGTPPSGTTGMPSTSGTPSTTGVPSTTGTPSTTGVPSTTGTPSTMPPGTSGTDSTMRSTMGAMGAGGGNAFDRAYIAQQVTAHARTLALVDAAIERGSQAELKTALQTQVRPSVAQHLQMAQQLQQRLGSQ